MTEPTEPNRGRAALATGALAAILASTCCLGPLILVTLGFSGIWISNLTVLEPYRPVFIGVALVALYFAYQRKPVSLTRCAPYLSIDFLDHRGLDGCSAGLSIFDPLVLLMRSSS